MSSSRKKILVAVDGSGHALGTVRYLSHVLPPAGVEPVLFSVLTAEPEYLWDDMNDPLQGREVTAESAWQNRQKSAMESFMDDALRVFTDSGFPAEAVKVKIQERKVGIARDIIHEAHDGYHAVVAGRQGTNPITRLVIGSVASKLIESLTHVPLWLVGKTDGSQKILVAFDGSGGASRAVEHLGAMVAGSRVEVTLLRVVRNFEARSASQGDASSPARLEDAATERPVDESATRAVFARACHLLEKEGIDRDRISTKVISGVATRSGSIIAQALSGGYGTIVLGRRGYSEVGEFYMGRVTNKVIQLASKMAVWVVS
jgi:nucleotide-binding universal stress UspA family protein